MSAATVRAVGDRGAPATSWDLYKGWIVGGMIILVILVVATVVWFHFHP